MTNLTEKAIKFQGKDYVLIKDRVLSFNKENPNGCIQTEKLQSPEDICEFKAIVYPDSKNKDRFFTGHASEKVGVGFINKKNALENAETSAVGRALAMMGIGVIDAIASLDELDIDDNVRKEIEAITTVDGLKDYYQKHQPEGDVLTLLSERKEALQNANN